jgi:hypothetical protein
MLLLLLLLLHPGREENKQAADVRPGQGRTASAHTYLLQCLPNSFTDQRRLNADIKGYIPIHQRNILSPAWGVLRSFQLH